MRSLPVLVVCTAVFIFGGAAGAVSDLGSYPVIFEDDFEVWGGWYNYSNGWVEQSSEIARSGSFSLLKTGSNLWANRDPSGGYKLIGENVSRGIVLEGYIYRPSSELVPGRDADRIGVEDAAFNGYSFMLHHHPDASSLYFISIDQRINGSPRRISEPVYLPFRSLEDRWYYWRFYIYDNGSIVFEVYNATGKVGSVSAWDMNYTSFDRVVVHGGYEYYVDDLKLGELREALPEFPGGAALPALASAFTYLLARRRRCVPR